MEKLQVRRGKAKVRCSARRREIKSDICQLACSLLIDLLTVPYQHLAMRYAVLVCHFLQPACNRIEYKVEGV